MYHLGDAGKPGWLEIGTHELLVYDDDVNILGAILGMQVNQDGLKLVHVSFWFMMMMMLIYWVEAYLL